MDRAAPMDMAITTAAARVTGADATAAGTEERMEATVGTGMCVGIKGTLPTLPIPNTDSVSSAGTRRITTEVGWDDIQ